MSPTPSSIEFILPLKVENDERGSDLNRALTGLIPTINRFAAPDFVRCLRVVVPARDRAAAMMLERHCDIPVRVVVEDDLLPVDRVGLIPRRGWYLQQLIKIGFSQLCETDTYLTLDADTFLLGRLDRDIIKDGKFPAHFERAGLHRGWWDESAKLLGTSRLGYEDDDSRVYGVTPAFINRSAMRAVIDRLDYMARTQGNSDWIEYLCRHANNLDRTWTEYSLYWTQIINEFDKDCLYYGRHLYEFAHSITEAQGKMLSRTGRDPLFGVLQSSRVMEAEFTRFVGTVLAHRSAIPPACAAPPLKKGDEGNAPTAADCSGRGDFSTNKDETSMDVGTVRSEGFFSTFDKIFGPKLLHREPSMRMALKRMLDQRDTGFVIVETGCVSKVAGDGKVYGPQTPPDHPWYPTGWHGPWATGMSTIIFDRFVQAHGGRVFSVDLNAASCDVARANTSELTKVTCSDSIRFLRDIEQHVRPELIDLLYLDSYDCDWNNPAPSSLHHLKELTAVFARLSPTCLILLDDCRDATGRSGKGVYVAEFLDGLGYTRLWDGYQFLWCR